MTTTAGEHDLLRIPSNNLLDGREYEEFLGFVYPDDLREGDVITTGSGTYQVSAIGNLPSGWDANAPKGRTYVRHIQISHTLAGPIMGGLLRGTTEHVQVLARRRGEPR